MNATYLLEKGIARSSKHEYEEDVARRWWALPLDVNLPLTNGESCQLIYAGRPGVSPGPDIRDVILSFTSYHSGTEYASVDNPVRNIVGDVEIHIRANPHSAVLPDAPGTLLEKLLATAHKRD